MIVQRKASNDEAEMCFISIAGMTCASCVDSIERNLGKVEGIHSVRVALLSHKAEVKYNPEYIIPSQIAHLINELGFRAEVLETVEQGVDVIDLNVSGREEENELRCWRYSRRTD